MVSVRYPGDEAESRGAAVYLEQQGERSIRRVVDAVRTVPWSITLLQLAWTAGPVTFVAMQGASLLGFGTPAPTRNVLFFAAYTLIAGLVGLAASIGFKVSRARREAAAHANLARVIDQLPDLVFAVRDQHLAAIDGDTRRREAAGLLLRKADLGPAGIALAVEALTHNAPLARAAAEIELYRRAGLNSRIHDLVAAHQDQVELAAQALAGAAPDEAAVLRERMQGRAPDPEDGVPRESNFVERVLAAMDEDSLALMTLRDAEEMLILAFECITGREIPVLSFAYRGRWRLARLIDEVEAARNRYRVAQATVHNRLRALYDRLSHEQSLALGEGAVHAGAATLFESCREQIEAHTRRLETARETGGSDPTLASLRSDLVVALEIAESLEAAYRQAARRHGAFVRALHAWEQRLARRRHPSRTWLHIRRRRGVRLLRDVIRLDDSAKLEVARALARYFDRLEIRTVGQAVVKGRAGRERPLSFEETKRLAIQVALVLEPHIGLTRPEVQRAINSTNAIYLSAIEPGTSATAKAAWGSAMGREIRTDLGRAAERLALTLAKTYHVALDAAAVRVLHEQYGADPDRLATMAGSQDTENVAPIAYPTFQPELRFDEQWAATLDRARRVVSREGRPR